MNDSPPDTREHFPEPFDIEQSRGRIGPRGAQKNMVGLMLAQHIVDEIGRNSKLAARFLFTREALFDQSSNNRTTAKCALHQSRFGEPGFQIVAEHVLIEQLCE